MSKTEETLSGAEILEWATKELVITELSTEVNQRQRISENAYNHQFGYVGTGIKVYCSESNQDITFIGEYPVNITRFPASSNRRIGYIDGVNSDGSFHIYVFGSGEFNFKPTKATFTTGRYSILLDKVLRPPESEYRTENTIQNYSWFSGTFNTERNGQATIGSNQTGVVSDLDSFEYHPAWFDVDFPARGFVDCTKYNGDYIASEQTPSSIQLRFNLSNDWNTLQLGCPITANYFQRSASHIYWGDKNIGGDMYDLLDSLSLSVNSGVRNLPLSVVRTSYELPGGGTYLMNNMYPWWNGSMAFHYTPYNLILTYNLDEAKRYVETGELPSDAFLYPFDVDNIPINETGGTGAEDSDGTQADDSISTGGDSGGEDTDDQNTEAPTNTPQALTNNNLYWLTSQQLKNFIEWFWTDATDVTDPQELFEKIQGLYSDLSQAIVSIRYMPIDAEWVGGVSTASSIIVGLVEKTETVRTINKTVAPVRDITPNDISISELPDFKGFINFSPYCEISLYLPFYGYLSLDADLLMQNKLRIKATYDILSGTIQYYIFRVSSKTGDATMVNTVTGKMAVDIPISLQTKNERDSMIFNNVASATANLIGAGASAVAGNPIGMVMSTSAIAGQQSQGAPMRVMGTIGESGAFYDHGHCAIFIKRPATNYPPQYARRVGYPYNGARKLEKTHGFVQCFNPYVEFTHMTVNDSDIQPPKPTAEEIETIYNALTEGVILP